MDDLYYFEIVPIYYNIAKVFFVNFHEYDQLKFPMLKYKPKKKINKNIKNTKLKPN